MKPLQQSMMLMSLNRWNLKTLLMEKFNLMVRKEKRLLLLEQDVIGERRDILRPSLLKFIQIQFLVIVLAL